MSVKPKYASVDAHAPSAAQANAMLSLSVAPVAFAAAGALSTLGWAAFWAGAATQMTRASLSSFGLPMSVWRSADAASATTVRSAKPQLTAIEGGAGKAATKLANSNGADVLPFPASTIIALSADVAPLETHVADVNWEEAPVVDAPVHVEAVVPASGEPAELLTAPTAAEEPVATAEIGADTETHGEATTAPVAAIPELVASAPVEVTVSEPVVQEWRASDPVVEPALVEPLAAVDHVQTAEPVAASPADLPVVAEIEAAISVAIPAAALVVADEPALAAASTRPKGIYAPRGGVADNLKQITGIGPKIEKVLNELGFFHFEQIAGWTSAEIEWIDGYLNFKGRVARDRWQAQADALATGGAAEYLKRFGKEPR